MDLATFVSRIPKAELHVHLEGCLSPSLARTLADRNGIALPDSVTKSSTTEGYAFHDLTSFLAVYYPAMNVLQNEQDFHDLAWDYLTKAHEQNVRHVELFFDPQAHTTRSIAFKTVIKGYRSAILRADTEYNMSALLIMCFLRDHSAESAIATLEAAIPYKDEIIGIGLDSDERGNPPVKFIEIYDRARKLGWRLTAHCDIDQENTLEHIRQALYDLKVERIDHGTNIIDSVDMTTYIVDNAIGLTCCPISNSIVTPGAKFPEMLRLLRKGVKVTVNSDDPAYFRGYLAENLLKMATETDLSREELIQVVRNGFEISWIDDATRQRYLQEVSEFCEQDK